MSDPMPLEELLNKWDDEDGYTSARSAGDEMARRLRKLRGFVDNGAVREPLWRQHVGNILEGRDE